MYIRQQSVRNTGIHAFLKAFCVKHEATWYLRFHFGFHDGCTCIRFVYLNASRYFHSLTEQMQQLGKTIVITVTLKRNAFSSQIPLNLCYIQRTLSSYLSLPSNVILDHFFCDLTFWNNFIIRGNGLRTIGAFSMLKTLLKSISGIFHWILQVTIVFLRPAIVKKYGIFYKQKLPHLITILTRVFLYFFIFYLKGTSIDIWKTVFQKACRFSAL